MSEAGTDEEIVFINLHRQSRPVVVAGSPAQNGPLLQQPGFAGGFFGTSGALRVRGLRPAVAVSGYATGAFVAYNGCEWSAISVRVRAAYVTGSTRPGPRAVLSRSGP